MPIVNEGWGSKHEQLNSPPLARGVRGGVGRLSCIRASTEQTSHQPGIFVSHKARDFNPLPWYPSCKEGQMNYDRRHSLEHRDRPRLTEQALPRRGNFNGLKAFGTPEIPSRRGATALKDRSRENEQRVPRRSLTSEERAQPTTGLNPRSLHPSKNLIQIVDGDAEKVPVTNPAPKTAAKAPKGAPQAAAPAPSGNTKRRDHRSALSPHHMPLPTPIMPQPQYVKGKRVRAEDLRL